MPPPCRRHGTPQLHITTAPSCHPQPCHRLPSALIPLFPLAPRQWSVFFWLTLVITSALGVREYDAIDGDGTMASARQLQHAAIGTEILTVGCCWLQRHVDSGHGMVDCLAWIGLGSCVARDGQDGRREWAAPATLCACFALGLVHPINMLWPIVDGRHWLARAYPDAYSTAFAVGLFVRTCLLAFTVAVYVERRHVQVYMANRRRLRRHSERAVGGAHQTILDSDLELPPSVLRHVSSAAEEEALRFCLSGVVMTLVERSAGGRGPEVKMRARHAERFFQLSSDLSTMRWSWRSYLLSVSYRHPHSNPAHAPLCPTRVRHHGACHARVEHGLCMMRRPPLAPSCCPPVVPTPCVRDNHAASQCGRAGGCDLRARRTAVLLGALRLTHKQGGDDGPALTLLCLSQGAARAELGDGLAAAAARLLSDLGAADRADPRGEGRVPGGEGLGRAPHPRPAAGLLCVPQLSGDGFEWPHQPTNEPTTSPQRASMSPDEP